MKIKSKQKDFYDGLQAGSVDTDCVYIRHTTEEWIPDAVLASKAFATLLNSKVTNKKKYHHIVIGFAGNVYQGIMCHPMVDVNNHDGVIQRVPDTKKYQDSIYSVGKFKQFLQEHVKDGPYRNYWLLQQDIQEKTVHGVLLHLFEKQLVIDKFFDKAPIWAMEQCEYGVNVVYNPILNNYEFGKVLNPHEAYNQLWRYIATKGRPEMEMPKISDEMNIQRHGFDPRYGFRKRPK